MKQVKLLLLDTPDQDFSEGVEVQFIVEDFTDQIGEENFFYKLRQLVRPNVKIFSAVAQLAPCFIRYKFYEEGIDPKM